MPGTPPSEAIAPAVDAESIYAAWSVPPKDGGATIDAFRVEFDADEAFGTPDVALAPVVSEYQLVGLGDVHLEVQSVAAAAWVQNEVQTVRTNIDGIDEIQTIRDVRRRGDAGGPDGDDDGNHVIEVQIAGAGRHDPGRGPDRPVDGRVRPREAAHSPTP